MKIVNRFTGKVIIEIEADLYRANLSGEDLYEADLYEADLYRANLSGEDLREANLYRANLSGADLSGADLRGANLYRANLRGANLYGVKIKAIPIIVEVGFKWRICITEAHIQIGCRVFTAVKWFSFSDDKISELHPDALVWWKRNKEVIKCLWENHNKGGVI